MSPESQLYITAAQDLYTQAARAGRRDGCLEVCLVALGAHLTFADVGSTVKNPTTLSEAVEKTSLRVNWEVSSTEQIDAADIHELLRGEVSFLEHYPNGEVAGYLLLENYPDRIGHAVVIIPEIENYSIIDTDITGNVITCTAQNLAFAANRILENGGVFEIAQMKKII